MGSDPVVLILRVPSSRLHQTRRQRTSGFEPTNSAGVPRVDSHTGVFLVNLPVAFFSLFHTNAKRPEGLHRKLFCLTMSFVFGRMTTKIILAHLTRRRFPYWTVMLAPLMGGAVLGNLPRFGLPAVSKLVELWYLRAYFVFAVGAYFRWATLVINRICSVLDINCLTIKKRSKPKEDVKLEGPPQTKGVAIQQTPTRTMETRSSSVLREKPNGGRGPKTRNRNS
jgi:hypothetical protein